MTLPHFRSLAARRQKERESEGNRDGVFNGESNNEEHSDRTLTPTQTPGVNLKLATKTRKIWIILSSILFFISVIFLILVIIGNISTKPVIRSTYFYKLDLANIIPASSTGSITFVNSLARSLGLHDFYQIGLWNFCEGYHDEGITYCSPPKTLYWFNPVETLLNELLAGATIALPADVGNILKLIKIASRAMFGFYLTGICMNFLSVFLAPLAIYSRWWSFFLGVWTFLGALLTTVATVIATVMSIIFRQVLTSQKSLNISASIGTDMFAFMWIASGCSIIGWLIHTSLCCCCASRRDVRTGRRKGRKSAYSTGSEAVVDEKKGMKMPRFKRKKTASEAV